MTTPRTTTRRTARGTTRRIVAGTAIAAGLTLAGVGGAEAANGPSNPAACEALNNAHNTIIAAQGLERHLTLGVHTQAFTKLLGRCAGA